MARKAREEIKPNNYKTTSHPKRVEIRGVKKIKKKKPRDEDMKIAVAGTGYVGLSIATLLAQHHHVTAVDIIEEKVEKINRRESPIQDE